MVIDLLVERHLAAVVDEGKAAMTRESRGYAGGGDGCDERHIT